MRRRSWLRGLVLFNASPPSLEPMDDDARDRLLALSFDGLNMRVDSGSVATT